MEDEKPRSISQNLIFNYYDKEMESGKKELEKDYKNLKLYLFQKITKKEKIKEMLLNIAYFYDQNYIGNKDFIHIPDIKKVIENAKAYPMIVISKDDENQKEEILGITTIKYNSINDNSINSYYPIKGKNVLSITGVLSKYYPEKEKYNRIRGIGRKLYKEAIKGYYNIQKKEKVTMICEIDCRNINSLKSISKAVKDLKEEGINTNLNVTGYYEIYNEKQQLLEAPTFILEIDFNKNQFENDKKIKISYENCNNNMYSQISNIIKKNMIDLNKHININGKNKIVYHEIKKINALNLELKIGNSAAGNERKPILPKVVAEYVKA